MLVPNVREYQLRTEVEVAPPGVIDEETPFTADEGRDPSRGLRDPRVEDQLVELQDSRVDTA